MTGGPGRGGVGTDAGGIVRPRLHEMLDLEPAPITVLQAPSGYGKTTLVRQWAAALPAEEVLVWVALNAGLESAHALWSMTIASARRLGHLTSEVADAVAGDVGAQGDPVPVFADLLSGTPGRVVVVLDAYEHVRGGTEQVDEDILRLVEALPAIRFIVTTRAATTLTEPTRQLRGAVRVVTESELQFTASETEQFLAAHAPHGQGWAVEVHRATRGYPLAIRAASLALASSEEVPSSGSADWHKIVAQNLTSQLSDPATIDFVRDTCVAPYFDLDLAQALTGADDVTAIIEDLERNGFGRWVPYLADNPVFQYVDSLREAVRSDLLASEPSRVRRSAGIAATWLHENGEYESAFELAIDARRYELASRIFRSALVGMLETHTIEHLELQMSRIPRAVLAEHSTLAFARGLALLANPETRQSAGEYLVRTAEQTGADWRGLDRPTSFFQRVAKSVSLRHLGRYSEAGAAASAALDFYDDIDIGGDGHTAELRALGLREIGYSLLQVGQLEQAHVVVSRAIAMATMPWSRNHTLFYGIGLAAVDGRPRSAARTASLVDPDRWSRGDGDTPANALGRIGKALMRLDDLDFVGALAELGEPDAVSETVEAWPFIAWSTLQARLGIGAAEREIDRISKSLRGSRVPAGVGDNFGTASLRGLLASAHLALGEVRRARAVLRGPTGWRGQLAPAEVLDRLAAGEASRAFHLVPALESQPGHSIRSRASLATLGAAAGLRAGHREGAAVLLARAASLYDEHGVRAHLLQLPGRDLLALRELADDVGDALATAYLDVEVLGGREFPVEVESVRLTAQEFAVLRAAVVHTRRSDLAAALHLSPETVKSHMRSIYRKWGVSTREAALERAGRLGLDLDADPESAT